MRALPGRPRPARRWAAAAAGVAVAAATTGAVAGPAAASAPSVDPAVALTVDGRGLAHVVVVLDDQVPQVSAAAATSARRAGVVAARQAPFLRPARASGGRVTHTYSVINGFAAEVSPAEAAALAATPGVRSVHPDRPVAVRRPVRSATAVRGAGGPATPGVQTQLCPEDPKKPLIAPEALSVMRVASDDPKAPSAHKLATGKGVRIAILADGFDIDDPEFVRPDGRHVVTDYKDVTGAGTAAPTPSFEGALDLSSTSAQGRVVRDLGDLGLPYLPKGCTIRVLGVAPDADVTAVKVLDADTSASLSWLVAGVDYAVTVAHADVVNESLLQHTYPDAPDDPWALANAAAVRAGGGRRGPGLAGMDHLHPVAAVPRLHAGARVHERPQPRRWDERVGSPDRGRGRPRHPGLPGHARWTLALAGPCRPHHHGLRARPRAARGRAGCRPGRRPGGGAHRSGRGSAVGEGRVRRRAGRGVDAGRPRTPRRACGDRHDRCDQHRSHDPHGASGAARAGAHGRDDADSRTADALRALLPDEHQRHGPARRRRGEVLRHVPRHRGHLRVVRRRLRPRRGAVVRRELPGARLRQRPGGGAAPQGRHLAHRVRHLRPRRPDPVRRAGAAHVGVLPEHHRRDGPSGAGTPGSRGDRPGPADVARVVRAGCGHARRGLP